jgi:hypothetical protein
MERFIYSTSNHYHINMLYNTQQHSFVPGALITLELFTNYGPFLNLSRAYSRIVLGNTFPCFILQWFLHIYNKFLILEKAVTFESLTRTCILTTTQTNRLKETNVIFRAIILSIHSQYVATN